MTRSTPLTDVHSALGATFTDFAGWRMPLRYTGDIAEHHAVRRSAGLFDLSHMGEIEVRGEKAAVQLDSALVGDISAIAVGRAKYTMLCADDGGVLDDLVVYRTGEHDYLIVANAANTDTVLGALRERVDAVVDAREDWALIAVQGPDSAELLGPVTADLRYYAIRAAQVAGHDVWLARTGYTGEDGFEIYCRPEHAAAVWAAIAATPAGLACRDSLRLEAGMPLYGHELSRERTPFEAGLSRIVAVGKPIPYAGQEALRERHKYGPTELLVGLAGTGKRSPRSGYPVLDPDGRTIGVVTSGIPSPTLGRPIAMAYVPAGHAVAGTEVLVDVRGTHEPHVVTDLPFYHRPRAQKANPR